MKNIGINIEINIRINIEIDIGINKGINIGINIYIYIYMKCLWRLVCSDQIRGGKKRHGNEKCLKMTKANNFFYIDSYIPYKGAILAHGDGPHPQPKAIEMLKI